MIKKDLKVNVQAILGWNFLATKFLPPYIFIVFFDKLELAVLLYQWLLHIKKRQKYCIRAFLSLEKWSFYSLSVMGHSLYWRRIWGRLWTKSSYWWTLCIKFKKICSNKKMTTVESRSELQLYCTSTHCHIQLGNQRLLEDSATTMKLLHLHLHLLHLQSYHLHFE